MPTQEELFRLFVEPVMRAVFNEYSVLDESESGPDAFAVRRQLDDGLWIFWMVRLSEGVNAVEITVAASTEESLPAIDFADADSYPASPGYRCDDIPGLKYAERFIPFEALSPEVGRALHEGLQRLFKPFREQLGRILALLRIRRH